MRKQNRHPFWTASLLLIAILTAAQAATEVPVDKEPRHHFSFENEWLRAFRVEVAPQDKTMLHRHDRDYFYIAIGAADIVNAVQGRAPVAAHMADLQIGFAKGGFAHVAENKGDAPFRNLTIEFKHPQTNLVNQCARVDPAQPANCPADPSNTLLLIPQFETAEITAGLLRIPAGGSFVAGNGSRGNLLMPIGESKGRVQSGGKEHMLQTGKELWIPAGAGFTVSNDSSALLSMVLIALKGAA